MMRFRKKAVIFWNVFNTFSTDVPILYLLKTSENRFFSDAHNNALGRNLLLRCISLIRLLSPLSAKRTKWSNTLKQFVSYCRRIVWVCFVGLAPKIEGLISLEQTNIVETFVWKYEVNSLCSLWWVKKSTRHNKKRKKPCWIS